MTIFIAYDQQDHVLGKYFEACKNNLLDFLEELKTEQTLPFEVILIPSHLCNPAFIDQKVSQQPDGKFVFVAYSHGHESGNGLLANGQHYIKLGENNHYFHQSLFYSNACSIGKLFGQTFENRQGCFIGFDSEVEVFFEYQTAFVNCDNYALFLFLSQQVTIEDALILAENYYEDQIRMVRTKWKGAVAAAYLEDAKYSLVLYGNRSLTRQDFV